MSSRVKTVTQWSFFSSLKRLLTRQLVARKGKWTGHFFLSIFKLNRGTSTDIVQWNRIFWFKKMMRIVHLHWLQDSGGFTCTTHIWLAKIRQPTHGKPFKTIMITEIFYWEFKLKLRCSRLCLNSVHFNQFSLQFYVRWACLDHNIPSSTKRWRTISSLLNSASEIPWRWLFSSITKQIAARVVSLNRGSCFFLLLKLLWLGPALISFPPLSPFPFPGPKYDSKPRHPVAADFFIWDKPFLGWIRFMTFLSLWFVSLQCQERVVVIGQRKARAFESTPSDVPSPILA